MSGHQILEMKLEKVMMMIYSHLIDHCLATMGSKTDYTNKVYAA
jgi:hypothetical protein